MAKTNEGKCMFCGEIYKTGKMLTHIKSCKARKDLIKPGEEVDEDKIKCYCILAQGYYDPDYWIYMDMPVTSTLKTLDKFLRDVWVECCGHLSQFNYGGPSPGRYGRGQGGEVGKNRKLEETFGVGDKFEYIYDFGTSTQLKLKIAGEYDSRKSERTRAVQLLARNLPPSIKCSHCEREAKYICTECLYDDTGLLCEECVKKHGCSEEMYLPVVNSPRVGECGYCGGIYDEEYIGVDFRDEDEDGKTYDNSMDDDDGLILDE